MYYYDKNIHTFFTEKPNGVDDSDLIEYTDEEYNNLTSLNILQYLGFDDNDIPTKKYKDLETIRLLRERNCFSIINRGINWHNRLTDSQKAELDAWYQAWLDVTKTYILPEKPSWLK